MFSRLKTLFGIFFNLSLVTLGGGLAMLPAIRTEFVEKRKWLTDEEMVDTVATMQSMPGIIACNMGVLLGYRMAGIPGALAAVLGSVLPPFIAIVALAELVVRLREYPAVSHLFLGVRAAICALILWAVINLGKQILQKKQDAIAKAFSWTIAVASFLALAFFGVNAINVLLACALLGWLSQFPLKIFHTRAGEETKKP